MSAPDALRSILIVGGGTAGWMTAAALSRQFGECLDIRLVESEEIGTVGVGESTVPPIRQFNRMLQFDERDFMRRTHATFKLGVEFRDWARIGDSYIHSFGPYGQRWCGLSFHHHWLRARAAGDDMPIEAYSLPICAARAGRFARPPDSDDAAQAMFPFAFQFDATLYAAFLRDYAQNRGVVRTEGKVVDVAVGENGLIDAVLLERGERITADLFVDCSGFRALLIGRALGVKYEDWTRWLPCNRAVALPSESSSPALPFTRAIALSAGWRWRIPLQHRVGNGYVFCSDFLGEDAATQSLLDQLDGSALAEPRVLRFTTGQREAHWSGNCIAIGLSAGFLEPLESTSIGLIQIAITYLMQLFPDRALDPMHAKEFNRAMRSEFERLRDFLILHYHATERDDSEFWKHCRTMPIPDALTYQLELFRERGAIIAHRDGFFHEPSWLAVLLGQRIVPTEPHPLAATIPLQQLRDRLLRMQRLVRESVSQMPTHADFIARYCPMDKPNEA